MACKGFLGSDNIEIIAYILSILGLILSLFFFIARCGGGRLILILVHFNHDAGSLGDLFHPALKRIHLGLEKLGALHAAEEILRIAGLLVAEDHLGGALTEH